tara:strand:+ start:2230 stop:2484 length:255 start_codon:yes stop_codon:yes gene_type:complete
MMKREMKYQIQGGVTLIAQSRKQIAYSMYEVSLSDEVEFETWMKETARRIKVQYGYLVRSDSATNFIIDLEHYKLIRKIGGKKK